MQACVGYPEILGLPAVKNLKTQRARTRATEVAEKVASPRAPSPSTAFANGAFFAPDGGVVKVSSGLTR